jgi:hypothetical protein
MRKSICLMSLLLAAGMVAGPATAAGFSGTTCNSPGFEAFMLARLGRGTAFNRDRQAKDRLLFGPIISATTVSNTGSTITCAIVVSVGNRRGPHQLHGRFTATARKGKPAWRWTPNY